MMKVKPNFTCLLMGVIALLLSSTIQASEKERTMSESELLVQWNETVLAVAEAEDKFLTLKGLRTITMMHLAIHNALNTIQPKYQTYHYSGSQTAADPISAAVQAAYSVIISQYPDQQHRFRTMLEQWLQHYDHPDQTAGIVLGKDVAAAIITQRENDGWNGEAEYRWHPMAPGVYAEFNEHSGTPEGFVFGAGWAAARPFMLSSPDQFRVPPPPAIDSAEYSSAFNEVKELGGYLSLTRNADQTHVALWWKDFAENSHNRLARHLVSEGKTELWDAARLFALMNMSIYDGYINSFENKIFYNHWRPYTAIRWAANDGNGDTIAEVAWDNTHQHTYAFPSYPSAHGTVCAAAMSAIAQTFGDDYAFTMTTAAVDTAGPFSEKMAMNPPQRSFKHFSQAAMECALSRIYLGIHFRYDSVEGNKLGTRVGEYASAHFLQPID